MYRITYTDNTYFLGGSPENSKWSEINKPIQKIEYVLGTHMLVLEGYEKYNHLVEFGATLGQGNQLLKIILMGLKGNRVLKIIFDMKKHTIQRQYVKLGSEYNGAITFGWKEGNPLGKESFNLFSKNC